jgi:hypothetical protein
MSETHDRYHLINSVGYGMYSNPETNLLIRSCRQNRSDFFGLTALKNPKLNHVKSIVDALGLIMRSHLKNESGNYSPSCKTSTKSPMEAE